MTTTVSAKRVLLASARCAERGAAMVTSLVTMFILMMAASSALSVGLLQRSAAKTVKDVDQAFLLAESGLDRALYEIQLGRDFGVDGIGNASGTLAGASYAVSVAPAFVAGGAQYTVTSTGTARGYRRRVQAELRKTVARGGFAGLNGISMSGGLADSYDSTLGTYASQVGAGGHAGEDAKLASNGNIAIGGVVWGDATPGPGMAVTGNTSDVHGSIAPATTPITMDPVVYTPPIPASGAFSGSQVFTSGVYRFTQFTVPAGGVVVFNGDVELYVDGKFTISGSGVAQIVATGSVKIYHGANDFTVSGGGIANDSQLPSKLQVFSASLTKFTCSGSGAFYGQVHCPSAQAVISGGGGVYGSLESRTMTISGGASIHYDVSLGGSGRYELQVVRPL